MTVFIDSNVFIFANIEEYPEHDTSVEKIEEIMKKDKVAINTIIISEVFHKLYKLVGMKEAKLRTLKILESDNIIFLPLEKSTIIKAIDLSSKYKLRINDSIIAQHTLENKASILTDNLKDFRKIPGLKIIPLKRS